MKKNKNKTIVIEKLENGGIRFMVNGVPVMTYNPGLSEKEITQIQTYLESIYENPSVIKHMAKV